MSELGYLYYVFEIGSFDHLEGEFESNHYTGKMVIKANTERDGSEKAPSHLIFGFDENGRRVKIGSARQKRIRSTNHLGEDYLACRLSYPGCSSYPFTVFHGEAHTIASSWPPNVWSKVIRASQIEEDEEENSE